MNPPDEENSPDTWRFSSFTFSPFYDYRPFTVYNHVFVLPPADVEFILGVVLCLPEQPDDDGTSEQRDEGQTVAQRGQNLHHPVEDQLHGKHTRGI